MISDKMMFSLNLAELVNSIIVCIDEVVVELSNYVVL